jgi:biopolymer transport protein ExbB/TolQ
VAAIPAVIAYNYYLGWARRMIIQMEDFSEETLNLFAKDIDED